MSTKTISPIAQPATIGAPSFKASPTALSIAMDEAEARLKGKKPASQYHLAMVSRLPRQATNDQ
jgi:hypothetical protein